MGSFRFNGVLFVIYPDDHPPPHAHGFYAETELIVDLDFENRTVAQSKRRRAVIPPNASRSDVNHILRMAFASFDELESLWKRTHG